VDSQGNLLPGLSGWVKDYHAGDAHRGVMNYNFRLTFAKDPALQVPIPPPDQYDRARYQLLANWLQDQTAQQKPVKLPQILDLYARRNGKFEVNNKTDAIISLGNFGRQFDYPDGDAATRQRVVADHWNYTLGLMKFLAEDASVPANVQAEMRGWGLHKGEFADHGHLPYELYVREARRMQGAAIVSQKDVQEERRKPDAIGLSSHFIDCHHVQRLALSPEEFVNEGRIWRMGYAYQIPYRALTPQAEHCTNLLVPGAASFSHVAFCTYRLESVWMIAGHAAGLAAQLASAAGTSVQTVDVAELQSRLRAERQIVDFVEGAPEKCERLVYFRNLVTSLGLKWKSSSRSAKDCCGWPWVPSRRLRNAAIGTEDRVRFRTPVTIGSAGYSPIILKLSNRIEAVTDGVRSVLGTSIS
jgi:hypothetical protein